MLKNVFVIDEYGQQVELADGQSPNDVHQQSNTRYIPVDQPPFENLYGSFDDSNDDPSRQMSDDWVRVLRPQWP